MLVDAMFKLREKVQNTPIGIDAIEAAQEQEQRQLEAPALIEQKGLLR
jgi:NADH-quinone oxidoreductase subunit B